MAIHLHTVLFPVSRLVMWLQVRDVEAAVRRFKTDLHNCVGYIQDPKLLKESIRALYQKHVQEDIVSSTWAFPHTQPGNSHTAYAINWTDINTIIIIAFRKEYAMNVYIYISILNM